MVLLPQGHRLRGLSGDRCATGVSLPALGLQWERDAAGLSAKGTRAYIGLKGWKAVRGLERSCTSWFDPTGGTE